MMFAASRDYYAFEEVDPAVVGLFKGWLPADGKTVLDVGCGRAGLGRVLEGMGFKVTGMEQNAVPLAVARERIGEVLEMDITDHEAVAAAIGDRRFDFLVFTDVLEHLADPLAALRFYKRFLAGGGHLVLTVPNVAVWDNRLRLLFGAFDYTGDGLMDRTHLRFFTFQSAKILIEESGLKAATVTFSPGIVRAFLPLVKKLMFPADSGASEGDPGAIMDSPAYKAYEAYIMPIERALCALTRGLLAFRIVIAAEDGGDNR